MNKLNFGCANIQPDGWDNMDIEDFGQEFIGSSDMIVQDNTYDIIVAHAVIQQFEWNEIVLKLKDLHRVLKPGGVLRISLPDIEKGFEAYQKGEINWFPNGEEKIGERFCAWLTWYSTSKTLLTRTVLTGFLIKAGFSDYNYCGFKGSVNGIKESTELDTREGEFFFVEAKK